jgi:hypothetical protein
MNMGNEEVSQAGKEMFDGAVEHNKNLPQLQKKEEYELVKPWEERVKSLEGMVIVIMLYGFLMLFAGFLLGAFFIGAGG